jgi:hypothetical protein
MDDTTRGLADDREDISGRADETTRGRATTGPPASATGETRRAASAPRKRASSASRTPGDDLDPETDQKTRQIQAEIAETREELAETIDAIQEKLRPSNIVSEASDKVKTATTERVRHMAESASETAQGVMRQTRDTAAGVVEGAKQNPIPALMIGAGLVPATTPTTRPTAITPRRSAADRPIWTMTTRAITTAIVAAPIRAACAT